MCTMTYGKGKHGAIIYSLSISMGVFSFFDVEAIFETRVTSVPTGPGFWSPLLVLEERKQG